MAADFVGDGLERGAQFGLLIEGGAAEADAVGDGREGDGLAVFGEFGAGMDGLGAWQSVVGHDAWVLLVTASRRSIRRR